MIISRLILKNWRNFRAINVKLENRVLLVGPNASGKSNFLDVFRFLHDVVAGGGLQKAVEIRGGFSKIRCLSARQNPDIEIEVHLANDSGSPPVWQYAIGIKQEVRGARPRVPYLAYERVRHGGEKLLDRPDSNDNLDRPRLTETYLEQVNNNKGFRDIAKFFESTLYLHLVPQLLKHPDAFSGPGISEDPFGRNFLERVAQTPDRIRKARLQKIEAALRLAVPQLKRLSHTKDVRGYPHLEAVYEHWRAQGAKQKEDQFSDGTLRLIGLLWSLLESNALLLCEEPELSLNSSIISRLPSLIHRLNKQNKRQIILSTHSADLLSGVDPKEVILLAPTPNGTEALPVPGMKEIKALLDGGFTLSEAILPRIAPPNIHKLQYELFSNGHAS